MSLLQPEKNTGILEGRDEAMNRFNRKLKNKLKKLK
jgi:hypothetical protein